MKKFLVGLLFGLFISLLVKVMVVLFSDQKTYNPFVENIEIAPRTVDSISLGIDESRSEHPKYIKQSI